MDDCLEYTGLDTLRALEEAHHYNALLVELIVKNAASQKTLIDFGAGIGTFARLLTIRGFHVVCIEPDAFLRAELSRNGLDASSDLDVLPDESSKFVFSLNVLEHIADDAATLRAIHSKLEKSGRLVIYVPAFEMLWSSLDDKVKHHRRYTRSGLKRLVRACGYEVKRCRYVDSLGFSASLLFKILGNKQGDLSPSAIRFYDRFLVPVSRVLDMVVFKYILGKNVYIVCDKP
jgi:SAM-dependent methyltransferase